VVIDAFDPGEPNESAPCYRTEYLADNITRDLLDSGTLESYCYRKLKG